MNDPKPQPREKLYSPTLLALAASLAEWPLDPSMQYTAESRSRTCGSVVRIGLDLSQGLTITRIGLQVSACAVGQSSAAILAQSARDRNANELQGMVPAIERWLGGEAPLPDWQGFEALLPAQTYPARHGALLLPWKAADEALGSAVQTG